MTGGRGQDLNVGSRYPKENSDDDGWIVGPDAQVPRLDRAQSAPWSSISDADASCPAGQGVVAIPWRTASWHPALSEGAHARSPQAERPTGRFGGPSDLPPGVHPKRHKRIPPSLLCTRIDSSLSPVPTPRPP